MVRMKEILSLLKANSVNYVLIGGMAAIAQGSAYLTNVKKAVGRPKDLRLLTELEALLQIRDSKKKS